MCSVQAAKAEEEDSLAPPALGLDSMTGLFLLHIFITLVAVSIHLLEVSAKRAAKKRWSRFFAAQKTLVVANKWRAKIRVEDDAVQAKTPNQADITQTMVEDLEPAQHQVSGIGIGPKRAGGDFPREGGEPWIGDNSTNKDDTRELQQQLHRHLRAQVEAAEAAERTSAKLKAALRRRMDCLQT